LAQADPEASVSKMFKYFRIHIRASFQIEKKNSKTHSQFNGIGAKIKKKTFYPRENLFF
jgi:hypothetical protein